MRDESENEPTSPAGKTQDNEPTISQLAKIDTDDVFAAIDALSEPSEKISNINTISEAELAGNLGAEADLKNDPDETQPIQFEDELQTTPLKDPTTNIHEPTETQRSELLSAFFDEDKKQKPAMPDSVTTDYKPAKS